MLNALIQHHLTPLTHIPRNKSKAHLQHHPYDNQLQTRPRNDIKSTPNKASSPHQTQTPKPDPTPQTGISFPPLTPLKQPASTAVQLTTRPVPIPTI
ncbi:hypothetical protein BDV30DRAFT_204796 [Aspergillus minisclerotigenes]|uniref:Uncharacterized protein n=1 Tax=Aspergillus minisclerotigenes TaxID=656917 RepID=A0A5N6JG51_9EURO|nr:hypothetical protein BDV30DRAFT_204796 [Aspergillus minisclerotigenes]